MRHTRIWRLVVIDAGGMGGTVFVVMAICRFALRIYRDLSASVWWVQENVGLRAAPNLS
jgi:hypothetical protein